MYGDDNKESIVREVTNLTFHFILQEACLGRNEQHLTGQA